MRSYRIGKADVFATSLLAATLCTPLAAGSDQVSFAATGAIFAIVFACRLAGRILYSLVPLPIPVSARFPSEFLAGTAGLSLFTLFGCLGLHLSAAPAFVVACLCFAGLAVVDLVRKIPEQINRAAYPTERVPFLAGCLGAMSIIWSWQVIRSFPRLQAENILFAWSDFFVHASLLARFTHYPAFNAPVLFSYGARIPLYHWASYMLPAAVCGFSHVPALVVATTLWVVFGHVLMALGAWALGAILADWLGGAAAMVLILMVPNASHYGLRDHFLDFAWMLQISSSLSYGLGFCLLSVGLCVVAVRKQSRITLSAAVALALAEATFKVHLFLLLAPTCSVFLLLLWPRVERRTRLIYFGGLAGIALLLAAVGERIRYAPHLFRGPHKVRQILHSMLDMPPSAAPNLFPAIEAATPHFVAVLLGLLLVLVAASGLLLPFYFGVWAYGRRRDLNRPEDCFPALLLAAYCLLILIFPTSVYKGAAEEYQHRNFVLIFAVLSVWCGVFAVRLLNRWQPARAAMVVAGCACLLLPAPLLLQKTVQTNVMPWCRSYVENTVPRGLLQSALYLRQAGSPRDIVFASEWRQDVVLTSLSEKPTLLAEGLLYKNEAIAHRAEVEKQLKSVRSFDEMVRIGREQAIGWYMASPSAPMPPDIRQHAASCVDGYCVIQLRP